MAYVVVIVVITSGVDASAVPFIEADLQFILSESAEQGAIPQASIRSRFCGFRGR